MKYKNHKKHRARLLTAVFAAVMLLSLLPITVSARENGHTVLTEDYYGLTDGNAAKVPGLNYRCSGHGDKMIEYYAEVEDDGRYTVPGIIEKVGNKLRYVYTYYCPTCYSKWKEGAKWNGEGEVYDDGSSTGKSLKDYMEFVANNTVAGMAAYGYYYPPKDDSDNAPQRNYTVGTSTITEQPYLFQVDENGCLIGTSGKALTTVSRKKPDEKDPLAHWDMPGAFAFYQFFYTGMSEMINKPASTDDPAWDTVRDMTRIYYMKRQQEGQLVGPRVNYSSHWYSYDYSMLGEWVVTDLMAEYKTGEICGYVSYVGQKTEIAVPETVTIPLYGKVKVIGVDIEDHNLKKVYINDNVTCIRRLSSVNLEEISGCKNLEYIEKYAFQNDVSLKTIPEMPKLDWIAMGAFEGCISLRDIKLPDNMTFIDFTAFGWYDTVLGNYDIGMTDQSWEDFQYLSDLSDNDKILGLTLYAKKGSTTYNLLDTLINKNDALTPALDDSGKPYFKSYGDAVSMMSGEVKEFTSHWNLKSSGDYKGNLASTDKDVDDSTGGRLGEYGEGEPSWKPKDIVKNGAVTGGLLLMLTTTVGIAGYEATKKNKSSDARKDRGNIFDDDSEEDYWGISEVYDDLDRADKTKLYFDLLDVFSKQLKKLGTYGKIGKELIDGGKKLQKVLDIYAETGDLTLAFSKVQFSDKIKIGEKVAGMATKAVPGIAVWDITTGIFFGNSRTADAVNFGANAEHTVDFVFDMCRAVAGETQKNPTAPKGTKYPGVFGVDEFCKKVTDGAYGENLKNIGLTGDLLLSKGSIGQTWNGIFGEDGMGFMGFVDGICQTATEATTDHSLISGYLLEHFNNKIEQFYENL
mgnify:FL=1